MIFYTIGTFRFDSCRKNSGIKGLVLDQKYNGADVQNVENLKGLADAGMLRTHPSCPVGSVPVRIFWSSYYQRYIATTLADAVECNNLLSLKIYYPSNSSGGMNYYSECSL